MPMELLLEEAKDMSDEALMEVLHYMRFLKLETRREQEGSLSQNQPRVLRKAGVYSGLGWMAEVFDAPLEDFREYM